LNVSAKRDPTKRGAHKSTVNLLLAPRRKLKSSRASSPEANPTIQAIWDVIATIPRGQVSTYGAIARAAGAPGRARLTGYALRMMEHTVELPWHRVIGAGGYIVFSKSSSKYREQSRLLRAEGVPVKDGRIPRLYLIDFETT
jgi:methylated-DNA-protein-cysteine methyltransferase-like protein